MVELISDENEESSIHFPLIQLRPIGPVKGKYEGSGEILIESTRWIVCLVSPQITARTRWLVMTDKVMQ